MTAPVLRCMLYATRRIYKSLRCPNTGGTAVTGIGRAPGSVSTIHWKITLKGRLSLTAAVCSQAFGFPSSLLPRDKRTRTTYTGRQTANRVAAFVIIWRPQCPVRFHRASDRSRETGIARVVFWSVLAEAGSRLERARFQLAPQGNTDRRSENLQPEKHICNRAKLAKHPSKIKISKSYSYKLTNVISLN